MLYSPPPGFEDLAHLLPATARDGGAQVHDTDDGEGLDDGDGEGLDDGDGEGLDDGDGEGLDDGDGEDEEDGLDWTTTTIMTIVKRKKKEM